MGLAVLARAPRRHRRVLADGESRRPALFNGRVLLLNAFTLGDRRCSGTFFETDYSDFTAWKTWGAPAAGAWNGFGMGALRASDGAFLLGCMGAHTFNAGAVYFPSGTPDRDDIVGGRVDLAGSVMREVAEETGLTPDDYRIAGDWTIVCHGAQVAAIRCLDLSLTAEAARLKILAASRPRDRAGIIRHPYRARTCRPRSRDAAFRDRLSQSCLGQRGEAGLKQFQEKCEAVFRPELRKNKDRAFVIQGKAEML